MNTVNDYLRELKKALANSDTATVQDALSDAEEYLSNSMEAIRETSTNINEEQALQSAISHYGSPGEVATAYIEAEQRLYPKLNKGKNMKKSSAFSRFFGVFVDPQAWGALLFMLISFVTGIVYFTWTVTGLSLSLAFLIFIFGLFFLLFFLYSLRGIALLDGRIVEALLGVRMPRRPLFTPRGLKWTAQLKMLVTDKHTWLTLIYTLLQLPLGVIYFVLLVVLLTISLAACAMPILLFGFHIPPVQWGAQTLMISGWYMPLFVIGGFLLMTLTLHLAKGIGILHGKWAKLLLVSD
jgi:uncharacterized membrane protein